MRNRGIGRRGPGLAGTMARTAVIAGTATAVSGSMSRKQQAKAQEQAQMAELQAQQEAAQQQAAIDAAVADAVAAQQVQQAPPPAPAAAAPSSGDVVTQLKELAALKDQGILSEEEFAAQKAKILGS